jgi:hypothetical protein
MKIRFYELKNKYLILRKSVLIYSKIYNIALHKTINI